MENPVDIVESAELGGWEESGTYRKLHSLKNIFPAGKGKGYISECICGWQSEIRDFLTARSALTDHVLDEADKLMEGTA